MAVAYAGSENLSMDGLNNYSIAQNFDGDKFLRMAMCLLLCTSSTKKLAGLILDCLVKSHQNFPPSKFQAIW